MSDLITTLHPQGDNSVNLYPNIKLENIVDGTAEDAGKFVKVNEEGKFIVDTVNIPEPQQVNNSTVTIKQGGVDKGSFTLNQAEDATIELDAGSGSNMYATSSAISKSVPAHTEAANPIQVGDTISQLYFNTQQDIGDYLADVVDWGNGNKVIYADGMSVYPLLTAICDENAAGFRELKTGSYIYSLKIKADYTPGDGKVDPELNNWLANALVFNTSIDLFTASPLGGDRNFSVSLIAAKAGAEYILNMQYVNGSSTETTRIYSSKNGFEYTSRWNPDEHAYGIPSESGELFITAMNDAESANWNGVFFGVVSNLGEIVLSAVKTPVDGSGSNFIRDSRTYALTPNLFGGGEPTIYYINSLINTGDSIIKAGWQVTADQAVALSGSKNVTSVNSVVSKIASSEANWESVPEVLGSIYQDDILGTDEVKINDILVDTTGTLGKVKEFSEESFKNQHPANPFAVGDEIPANSYIYIDTSITPDLSKIDWSGFVSDGSSGLSPLAPLGSFQLMQFSQSMAMYAFGIKLNKPIYTLMIGEAIYTQVDPSDVDKLAGSSIIEDLGGDMNTWIFYSEQVTHEGSIFKVPLGNSGAVTLTDISDQDVWGAFISKDGRWVEDTPISRTKVSCEALRQLPTNYDNLDGIPIIKSGYVLTDARRYEFIPQNYINKYIQDPTGIIYFCDGQKLYQLTGSSASRFTVDITTQNGLRSYSTSTSDTNYSTTIGLTDTNLGNYSQADGDQVFGKRSGNNYGWMNLPSQSGTSIQAGSGIEVSGNTVNLTSRYVNKEINSTNTDMFVMARGGSSMSDPIGWGRVIIPHGITAGTGLVEESTNPSDQTKISLSSSDLNYSHTLTKVYSKNTSSNTFGWISLDDYARTCHAGTGISIERSSTSDTVSLSQDVQNKLARIPDLPSADGNYALTCTITGGVPTFAWTLAN